MNVNVYHGLLAVYTHAFMKTYYIVVCESMNVYHGLFACMSQFTLPR